MPDSWLDERDTANGWQARDVVGHLISAELSDWIPRAEIIEEHGTSRPFDPFDRFEMLERDRGVPLDTLIDRFAELRQQSLARLHELVHDETDLDKRGLHPDPAIGEVTMRQLIATWAVHDLDHVPRSTRHSPAATTPTLDRGRPTSEFCVRRDAPQNG